jgi:hypothetical protein
VIGRARVMVEDDVMLERHDGQYREGAAIVSKCNQCESIWTVLIATCSVIIVYGSYVRPFRLTRTMNWPRRSWSSASGTMKPMPAHEVYVRGQ